MNIVALRDVSGNFIQVTSSLVPAIVVIMGRFMGKSISLKRIIAVVPVVVGVAMTWVGHMTYTTYTSLLNGLLAALTVVASGEMLTGSLKLHPVDLLGHMAPLATITCLTMSFLTLEIDSIVTRRFLYSDFYLIGVVVMSGFLSFIRNISTLMANKLTSPLSPYVLLERSHKC